MRKAKEVAGRKCPECGKTGNQMNARKNRSGTQRRFCKKYYTLNPKTQEYPEEVRQQAIKTYYAGVSGRGVRKMKYRENPHSKSRELPFSLLDFL